MSSNFVSPAKVRPSDSISPPCEAGDRRLRAGQAGQELMRPGEVEVGDSGIEGEDNAQGLWT
jgi:hypothetical protein